MLRRTTERSLGSGQCRTSKPTKHGLLQHELPQQLLAQLGQQLKPLQPILADDERPGRGRHGLHGQHHGGRRHQLLRLGRGHVDGLGLRRGPLG